VRGLARGLAVIVLVAALVAVGFYVRGERAAGLAVVSMRGEVLHRRGGSEYPAEVGRTLTPGDRVRTGPDGEAVLQRGTKAPIRLGGNTTVELVRLEPDLVEVMLERGTVRAKVRPDAGAVRLAAGARAVLATDADLGLAVEEDGTVTVEAERGAVALSGFGDHYQLREPGRLTALPDGAVVATEIPAAPLLDVAWPGRTTTARVSVEGRATPGARLTLWRDGADAEAPIEVRADAEGRFRVALALVEGDNRLRARITDPFGATVEASAVVVRDSRAPTFRLDLDYRRR
jgi:hypothetical protein